MTEVREQVTMKKAAELLGVSNAKIWRLVKEGALSARQNPLDRRQKLIRVEDLQRLTDTRGHRQFASDGVVTAPEAPHSDELEEFLETHWLPR